MWVEINGVSVISFTVHGLSRRSVVEPIRFPLAIRKLYAMKSVTSLFASEIGRCVEDTARVMVSLTEKGSSCPSDSGGIGVCEEARVA